MNHVMHAYRATASAVSGWQMMKRRTVADTSVSSSAALTGCAQGSISSKSRPVF